MRIENGSTTPISNGNGLGSVGQVGSNSRTAGATANDHPFDNVTLSNASDLVGAAMDTQSPERNAQVASLAAQVRSGNYTVDPSAVTQALIKNLT